ncbi:DUF4126 family protein [Granulicella arctica]|uniref:DUF4126 family protein n=1 Tax=Granulicella arctica TaxID=940613 RepID=UPI0021E0FBBD|nr:DUF4126 family protein [Granulicella arctica]
MAIAMLAWLVAIPLLGFATGLRTMTPIAVVCWFAYLGYLPIHRGWAFWTAHVAAVIVFTVFAVGEYIGDKLPNTPNRTAAFPLIARLSFGGLVGAIAATALKGSVIEGVILGALGALFGTFAGYHLRRDLVTRTGWPDWVVAVSEDVFAVVLSVFAMGIVTG